MHSYGDHLAYDAQLAKIFLLSQFFGVLHDWGLDLVQKCQERFGRWVLVNMIREAALETFFDLLRWNAISSCEHPHNLISIFVLGHNR